MVDALAIASSNFNPMQNPLLKYEIRVRYRPSVLDNVKHWQVFEDDEKIKNFMEVIEEFLTFVINQEGEVTEEQLTTWEETIARHIVLHLKGNSIPHGLFPLEILFKSNDVTSKLVEWEFDE